MPIQMLTLMTAIRASDGAGQPRDPAVDDAQVAQETVQRCRCPGPGSHRHAALETISGSSQGSRSRARRMPLSGKLCAGRTGPAPARCTNWPMIEPIVNSAVFSSAVENNDVGHHRRVVRQPDPRGLAGEERPERVVLEAHDQVLDHRVAEEQRRWSDQPGPRTGPWQICSRRRPLRRRGRRRSSGARCVDGGGEHGRRPTCRRLRSLRRPVSCWRLALAMASAGEAWPVSASWMPV